MYFAVNTWRWGTTDSVEMAPERVHTPNLSRNGRAGNKIATSNA